MSKVWHLNDLSKAKGQIFTENRLIICFYAYPDFIALISLSDSSGWYKSKKTIQRVGISRMKALFVPFIISRATKPASIRQNIAKHQDRHDMYIGYLHLLQHTHVRNELIKTFLDVNCIIIIFLSQIWVFQILKPKTWPIGTVERTSQC